LPVRILGSVCPLLIAVVTKTRSPQTIGHECPRPGIGVFQRTLVPALTSQVVGGCCPSATPVAPGPRNGGQSRGLVTAPAPSFGAALALATGLAGGKSHSGPKRPVFDGGTLC